MGTKIRHFAYVAKPDTSWAPKESGRRGSIRKRGLGGQGIAQKNATRKEKPSSAYADAVIVDNADLGTLDLYLKIKGQAQFESTPAERFGSLDEAAGYAADPSNGWDKGTRGLLRAAMAVYISPAKRKTLENIHPDRAVSGAFAGAISQPETGTFVFDQNDFSSYKIPSRAFDPDFENCDYD